MTASQCSAVILCGGRGERLGLGPKGLVSLGGLTLVERVAASLPPLAASLWVNVEADAAAYRALGFTTLSDGASGEGPLVGIAAALHQTRTEWLLVAPGDAPFVVVEVYERLWAVARREGRSAVAVVNGEVEALFCVVPVVSAASLQAYLDTGARSVRQWHAATNASPVDCSDLAHAFFNVNTPVELEAAQQRLAQAEARNGCATPGQTQNLR